jgi:hypothetical protein
MDPEEPIRPPIGKQYESRRNYLLRASILIIIPLSLYWSGLGFIARQWVGRSSTAGVSALIFLATPFLGFYAWRLNRLAGFLLFLGFFASIWAPPWVVTNTREMTLPTIVGLVLAVIWSLGSIIDNTEPGSHA